MFLRLFFLYHFLVHVHTDMSNRFVVDYFYYKKSWSVIGYTCNDAEDDLALIRNFSERNISAAVYKLTEYTSIHISGATNYWKLGLFIDTRCYSTDEIFPVLHDATNYSMYDELRHWLILSWSLDEVLDYIEDQAFGLSTDFVIAAENETDEFRLYDLYNMFKDRGGILNVSFLGNWNLERSLDVFLTQPKYDRRANLHGLRLAATFYKSSYKPATMPLEEYYEDYDHATKDAQSKFAYHILSHLSDIYNFTLVPRETPKWEPGDRNGPIVKSLVNHTADLTGTPISMNVPRTYLMKYIHQDWPFRTCFFFRNPQPKDIKFDELIRPFAEEIWYLMMLMTAVAVVVLYSVFLFDSHDSDFMRLSNSVLIIFGAICQQGTDIQMNRISTRIAFFFSMIFCLLIYNYYSASVVSARLDEPIYKINDSLVEFSKLNLKMASEWMVYLEFFLKQNNWETQIFYNSSWLKLPESERFMLPELGIRLVREGGFAYHTHAEIGYEFIDKTFDNREICELTEVHVARPIFTAFGVTINSTIVEITRVGMIRVSETGLKKRQLHRWQYRKPKCRKDVLSASSINIYEFATHLILLMIGMIMALVICIVEIIFSKYRFDIIGSINIMRRNLFFRGEVISND